MAKEFDGTNSLGIAFNVYCIYLQWRLELVYLNKLDIFILRFYLKNG